MNFFRYVVILLAAAGVAMAAPMSVIEALKIANEVDAIKGKNHRLYALSFEKNEESAFFAFTFFDGEKALHSVNVNADGATRYQIREAGKMSLFEDVDFSSLPPCDVHCAEEAVDGLVQRARDALDALKIERGDRQSMRLAYHVRRKRDEDGEVHHCWSVTLPLKAKGEGMRVGFVDDKLKSLNPAKLR